MSTGTGAIAEECWRAAVRAESLLGRLFALLYDLVMEMMSEPAYVAVGIPAASLGCLPPLPAGTT